MRKTLILNYLARNFTNNILKCLYFNRDIMLKIKIILDKSFNKHFF